MIERRRVGSAAGRRPTAGVQQQDPPVAEAHRTSQVPLLKRPVHGGDSNLIMIQGVLRRNDDLILSAVGTVCRLEEVGEGQDGVTHRGARVGIVVCDHAPGGDGKQNDGHQPRDDDPVNDVEEALGGIGPRGRRQA